jgi:hypothetical protein
MCTHLWWECDFNSGLAFFVLVFFFVFFSIFYVPRRRLPNVNYCYTCVDYCSFLSSKIFTQRCRSRCNNPVSKVNGPRAITIVAAVYRGRYFLLLVESIIVYLYGYVSVLYFYNPSIHYLCSSRTNVFSSIASRTLAKCNLFFKPRVLRTREFIFIRAIFHSYIYLYSQYIYMYYNLRCKKKNRYPPKAFSPATQHVLDFLNCEDNMRQACSIFYHLL